MINYSILNSVAAQAVNLEKINTEISASGLVADFSGASISGDNLEISGGDVSDVAALDLLIKNHEPVSLADAKAEKKLAIDNKTRAIIAQGFTFDGNDFSLSPEAQINWLGLVTLQSLFTFPIGVTNNNDDTYMLSLADLIPFVTVASSKIVSAVADGRTLKVQVNNAVDQAEIDAVADSR